MNRSEDELRKAFAKSVYLHAVGGPLTHNADCLAEGLMELGVPVLGASQVTSRPVSMPLKGVDLTSMVSEPFAGFAGYIIDISHTNQFAPFEGVTGSVDAMLEREQDWPAIAAQGRAWATQHYAPKPTATRVLSQMLDHAKL